MWLWLLGIVIAVWLSQIQEWLIMGGVGVGTLSDFLIRRCLLPFISTFILAGLGSLGSRQVSPSALSTVSQRYEKPYMYTGRSGAWWDKNWWVFGIFWTVLIETIGVNRVAKYLHPGGSATEVFFGWLAQWWIILIALGLGVLGAYCGKGLAQQLHKRPRKNLASQQSEN
jgi:hypothetical protein